MSIQTAVAAPFRHRGTTEMPEPKFVATVAMELKWFSPDQAKRLIDIAAGEGLLERTADGIEPTFDVRSQTIPDNFTPDEDILQKRSVFERILDKLVSNGVEKQTAVAEINQLQSKIGTTIEAAAIVYARQQGIKVKEEADLAFAKLTEQ